ncbi:peptidyl-tRNA hydrolase [Streptomyces sp. NBC_00513]|uniref:aminoacyl-tRNA hydrolase n=1 Tax=unclassified Streptomyces TaxID=2593676 RepID=UPI0022534661|nr:aminoacyl-tRNA hydrolase [Streptomyces sp. NBC_00424]MCX5072794.1 peptidyl-tRNA hydrolase [Streptomyces sp. NBC_00424]WUD43901.1 peptidyl-tRNA hydrolase [Streptomyces sp. NBC_00513]
MSTDDTQAARDTLRDPTPTPVPAVGADSPFRREHAARDEARQFVLPLVVRIEKVAPPARTAALETAARAVLVLLTDERAHGEGEWAEAVRDWQDARIRKVVRRARGAEWRKAGTLPGVTVHGEASVETSPGAPARASGQTPSEVEVRVFPPVPLDGWPKELAKLQVSGTDLDDPEPVPPAAPGVPVLWLNPDLDMSAGKAMAQAGHAAQLAWWELGPAERAAWRDSGFRLAVRTAPRERWAELSGSGLPVVRDAGFTEIAPGSCTVVSDHPALRARL